MKKTKLTHESSLVDPHHKFAENILKKKPNRQFELLYRERDQSIQENPVESIIFVKSKHCKLTSNSKKIKVQEQFKKIMNDLDTHINQHKKAKSSQKKTYSPTSSHTKGTTNSKKQTKQSDFASIKNKTVQKDTVKLFKAVNKGNYATQNLSTCKSPKKNDKNYLSPHSKRILSPKSPKIQKENIETKRFNYTKLDRTKSPHKKSNRKGYSNETQSDETLNKEKFTEKNFEINHHSNHHDELRKTQIKRNIRRIPLKVEEYILLEDNFQLIKQKSLYKLQTKLLSTYRNNVKQFENKLHLKENSVSNQFVLNKLNKLEPKADYLEFIQGSQQNSGQNHSQFNLQSENQIKNFQLTEKLYSQNIQNIILIQKWWRNIFKIKFINNYIGRLLQPKKSSLSRQIIQTKINNTTPANIPSAKSITINQYQEQQPQKNQNEQMTMLKNQNQIVRQKKNMHEKILQNLFKEQKITKNQFDAKMSLVQKEYEKQIKDIMGLYRLCEGQSSQNQFLSQNDNKISQGKQTSNHSDSQKKKIKKDQEESESYDEVDGQEQIKMYTIGDKITSEMQSFIQNAKKSRDSPSKAPQNNSFSEKYNVKTNQLGQEYFQDFQSESSNDASPHKMFQPSNFDQFEAEIEANSEGFQPNTNFIQMLQQFKEQQEIKSRIENRIAIQMGAFKPQNPNQLSIDTSILGIHQFLVNFFKFYLHYYKDEFLRFINMPYGYQPEKRLKFIQGYQDTNDDLSEDEDGIIYGLQYIISDDIFEEFIAQYYGSSLQNANEKQRAIIECSQMHDKALFECFNEALNNFRPYYSIGGPPYIWNCSQKTLTFYFIAEQNIQEVFEKTEFKVMKWASALLGLYVEGYDTKKEDSTKKIENNNEKIECVEQILQNNHSKCHPIINESRQERLIKEERLELIDSMSRWGDVEEQRTSTFYELSSLILEELADQFIKQFLMRSN